MKGLPDAFHRYDFLSRFGVSNAIRRNADMINTISHPDQVVTAINDAYNAIGAKLSIEYRRVYVDLTNLGVSPEEARARADNYIAPILKAELKLLKIRFPFSFGKDKSEKGLAKGVLKSYKSANLPRDLVTDRVQNSIS